MEGLRINIAQAYFNAGTENTKKLAGNFSKLWMKIEMAVHAGPEITGRYSLRRLRRP